MNDTRTRHFEVKIPQHDGSFALLSTSQEVDRAIFFVHGYSGSARSTWSNFFSLVDSYSASRWWQQSDLYFIDYWWDSIFKEVAHNTVIVRTFIESLWPTPHLLTDWMMENFGRSSSFAYKDIVLVGHSEGGLILRKLIVDIARSDSTLEQYRLRGFQAREPEPPARGLLKADLRLFAPAIGGASLSGILGVLASLPVISHVTHLSAAKKTLEPESASVTAQRDATDKFTEFLLMPCFRAHIVWAEVDSIVVSQEYLRDVCMHPPPPNTIHTNVCRPNYKYMTPIQFVEHGIR